jgi:hypothetical protein
MVKFQIIENHEVSAPARYIGPIGTFNLAELRA